MYADVTDVISLFNFSITPYIQGRDAVRVSGSTNFDSRTVLDILATLVWRCRAPAKETRSSQNMNATSSQETHQSVISNWGQWVPRWLIHGNMTNSEDSEKSHMLQCAWCSQTCSWSSYMFLSSLCSPGSHLWLLWSLLLFECAWAAQEFSDLGCCCTIQFAFSSIFFPDCKTVLNFWWTRTVRKSLSHRCHYSPVSLRITVTPENWNAGLFIHILYRTRTYLKQAILHHVSGVYGFI